jgi:predicted TIM-barrel fold metal-dependent hydrolase
MKVIDAENHFASEAWLDALRRNSGYPKLVEKPGEKTRLYWSAETWVPYIGDKLRDLGDLRIKYMDEAGIDVAVLSLAASGAEPFEPGVGTEVARKTNDELAEAIDRYPDRFLGYATLAPKDVDTAVKELERAVRELGFKGWHTHSNFGDSFIDEKRYWPILAKVEELGVPIYIHPTAPIVSQLLTYGLGLAGASFGFGAETSMVMMRLVISGAFDAFPKLKIILGHYAEGLPFMIDRVDRPYIQGHVKSQPEFAPDLKHLPSHYLQNNMYATTSGNYQASAALMTRDELGSDKILLGTDFPYEDMTVCIDFLNGLPLSAPEQEMLFEKNALNLGFAD